VRGAWTLAVREWKGAFETPVAWLLLALFPATTAGFFFLLGGFFEAGEASLRGFFALLPGFFVVLAPALSMRSWAEEHRSGTRTLLFTWPFPEASLVLGKFLGGLGLLALALAATAGVPLTVATLGDLDPGPVAGGYLGALLLGSACLALGQFLSACTRNQVVAWVLGVLALLGLNLLGVAATAEAMPERLGRLLLGLDFGLRFQDLTRGVLALDDLGFFAAFTAFFLFLNVLLLEARRWSG